SPFSFLSGVRTYYLYSPSSQAKTTQTIRFSELFSVKGESVAVDLSSGTPKSVMERLLKETGAEVVLVEKVGGVQSYYCHSKRLGETVLVGGYAVNLHVAINEEETRMVVGTPIIFGGY
ncbi:MAG: YwmB family TATA-box binding protein, partial [Clostridia bacterium]|nr:YwmB family TATA-box binding protein [Clostridia bacterium]